MNRLLSALSFAVRNRDKLQLLLTGGGRSPGSAVSSIRKRTLLSYNHMLAWVRMIQSPIRPTDATYAVQRLTWIGRGLELKTDD